MPSYQDNHSSRDAEPGRLTLNGLQPPVNAIHGVVTDPGKHNEEAVAAGDTCSSRHIKESANSLLTRVYIIGHLIFFSILGTLARLGVQWLSSYPGASIAFPNLWANVGGSLFMGFLSEDQKLFRQECGQSPRQTTPRGNDGEHERSDGQKASHGKAKKGIPLFVGLATGFCGSFTSFSTFMRDAFLALANSTPSPTTHSVGIEMSPAPRNGGYSFMAVVAVLTITVSMSIGSLLVGAHLANALDPFVPTLPFRVTRKLFDPLCLVLGVGVWVGAILLAIFPPDRPGGPEGGSSWASEDWRGVVLFALAFAPAGCLARYYASLQWNARWINFPLGTFAVNMAGTAILSMCYSLQHVPIASLAGGGLLACQVLQGIEDGFDGCLTTVSTWALELTSLKRKYAYLYGLASLLGGISLTVIIMGSVKWSLGFQEASCVTSRTFGDG